MQLDIHAYKCKCTYHILAYKMVCVCVCLCIHVQALADTVSSHKRATADGQCREECLLQETASKEAAMATRMEELQAELKQSRLALANSMAENERLSGLSTQLKKVF